MKQTVQEALPYLSLLRLDAVHNETAFAVVQDAEELIGPLNADHIWNRNRCAFLNLGNKKIK